MADSIMLPEAECSFGIGTAIKIPVSSLSFMFASRKWKQRSLKYFEGK